jgi:large subunit ribosomal protein L34
MTKRTLKGTNRKSIKKSGFRQRMATKSGSKIISGRRKKGRNRLTI